MKKRPKQLWVAEEFARQVKIEAVNDGKSILEYTKQKAEELKSKKKLRYDFRI